MNSDDAINCWQGWWIWPSENIIDWKHIMTSDEKVTVIEIYNSYSERLSTFKSMVLRVTDWDDNNCYCKLIVFDFIANSNNWGWYKNFETEIFLLTFHEDNDIN